MYPTLTLFSLEISTYFLIISLAVIIGIFYFLKRAEARGLARVMAIDIAIVCLVSGFVGARLTHVFYEEPAFYLQAPLRIFQFWYGGFVFLGGLLGAAVGTFAFCAYKREAFLVWADVLALPAALTYALGRLACFFNGCCYGRFCNLPWAVTMAGGPRHPTQLYASGIELAILLTLSWRQQRTRISGVLFATWLILHSLGRLVMEFYRDDPRGNFILGFSLGTWMSLFLLAASVTLLAGLPVMDARREV